jgi:hypothetical protein
MPQFLGRASLHPIPPLYPFQPGVRLREISGPPSIFPQSHLWESVSRRHNPYPMARLSALVEERTCSGQLVRAHRSFDRCRWRPSGPLPALCKSDTGFQFPATKFADRRIGFQVAQYHSDVDGKAGIRGSKLRREESRKENVGLPAAMFVNPMSMSALTKVLRDKAKKGWSQKDFPDMRLLVPASTPQLGGTFLFEACLDVNEMNAQLSPILEQTKFSAAYLYVMMPESVHRWTNERGWESSFSEDSR